FPARSPRLPHSLCPSVIPQLTDHQRGHLTQIAAATIQYDSTATATTTIENKLPLNHAPRDSPVPV
ncbi:hypothetical protein SJS73_13145, partial [Aeromonas caviae]|uniref:hypothetical protein n=1 Tax=Aeromonas caviae TaxID=648 RepID=UPI0029D756AB